MPTPDAGVRPLVARPFGRADSLYSHRPESSHYRLVPRSTFRVFSGHHLDGSRGKAPLPTKFSHWRRRCVPASSDACKAALERGWRPSGSSETESPSAQTARATTIRRPALPSGLFENSSRAANRAIVRRRPSLKPRYGEDGRDGAVQVSSRAGSSVVATCGLTPAMAFFLHGVKAVSICGFAIW